ncbi:putative pectinesterase/pectinesterase inhibitor 32 [Bienertia sinuspersici]
MFATGIYFLSNHHHHKPPKSGFDKTNQYQQPKSRKTKLYNYNNAPIRANMKKHNSTRTDVMKFDAVVSANGDGKFATISEAILSAPSYSTTRFFIRVRAGVYNEVVTVPQNKSNIVLIGDGVDVTKITANRHPPQFTTSNSATFSVFGDGFMAQDITFENNAGGRSGQAVAVLCNANHTIFYKCKFLGYQDTLYAKHGTQYYRDCDIYGTVDFVFGFATAVFQKCNLYARVLGSYQQVTYTAQGRKSLDQKSGFTMQGCNFTLEPKVDPVKLKEGCIITAYLGRPWFPYSTVVVMESYLGKMINSSGWEAWDGNPSNNATYLEFKNWGPGANSSNRVKWPGFKIASNAKEAIPYTASQLIQGDEWIPNTGVPYNGGFLD